jgi:hypothetical protein
MLAEGSGTMMSQEGWGAAYNAIGTNDDDKNSFAESTVSYAERATAAKSKVSELESRLSVLEHGVQPHATEPPANVAYFTPQAPTFHYPAPPATVMIPPPQHGPQIQPPQQHWGGHQPQPLQHSGAGSQHRRKKWCNNAGGYGGEGGSPFEVSPNVAHNQQTGRGHNIGNQPNYGTQPNHQQRYGHQQGNQYGRQRGGQPGGRGNGLPYYNTSIKVPMPDAPQRPHPHCETRGRPHHLGRKHESPSQTLPDGTCAGMEWILAQNLHKANFVMDKRQENYQQLPLTGRGGF